MRDLGAAAAVPVCPSAPGEPAGPAEAGRGTIGRMATTAAPGRTRRTHRRPVAPTLADAENAAKAIAAAEPRVEQVLVFGSVARGDARPGSDLDLLALTADCDPSDLPRIQGRCWRAATETTGTAVDVTVERRAGYEHLAANVAASFEHAVSSEAVSVYPAGPLPPATGSLDGVARDNLDVAAADADGAFCAMEETAKSIRGIADDERLIADDPAYTRHRSADQRRTDRNMAILQHAHLSIERSASAVRAACGLGRVVAHKLEDLVAGAGGVGTMEKLAAVVASLAPPGGETTTWRSASYAGHTPEWRAEATAENASAHVEAAAAAARIAAESIRGAAATEAARNAADMLDSGAGQLAALPHDPETLRRGPEPGRSS